MSANATDQAERVDQHDQERYPTISMPVTYIHDIRAAAQAMDYADSNYKENEDDTWETYRRFGAKLMVDGQEAGSFLVDRYDGPVPTPGGVTDAMYPTRYGIRELKRDQWGDYYPKGEMTDDQLRTLLHDAQDRKQVVEVVFTYHVGERDNAEQVDGQKANAFSWIRQAYVFSNKPRTISQRWTNMMQYLLD